MAYAYLQCVSLMQMLVTESLANNQDCFIIASHASTQLYNTTTYPYKKYIILALYGSTGVLQYIIFIVQTAVDPLCLQYIIFIELTLCVLL